MDKPQLFYAARACSMAAMVALDWADITYEPIEVSLAGDRAALRAYSNEARVPALVVGSRLINENLGIFLWAAEQNPSVKLLPEGQAAIDGFALMSWLASRLHIVRRAYVLPQHFSPDPAAHDSIRSTALPKYVNGLAALDGKIAAGELAAPALKAYALVFAHWALLDGIETSAYPALMALARDLGGKPFVQEALRLHHF